MSLMTQGLSVSGLTLRTYAAANDLTLSSVLTRAITEFVARLRAMSKRRSSPTFVSNTPPIVHRQAPTSL
jgi:hypothetical protein